MLVAGNFTIPTHHSIIWVTFCLIQGQLDRHQKCHKDDTETPHQTFTCSQCESQFKRLSLLKEHMKQHYKVKWASRLILYFFQFYYQYFIISCCFFQNCDIVLIVFCWTITLNFCRRSLSHRIYKRDIDRSRFVHQCESCFKSFQKPSQLERHMRIHTGELMAHEDSYRWVNGTWGFIQVG